MCNLLFDKGRLLLSPVPIPNHMFFRLKKLSSLSLSSYSVSALYLVVVTTYWAPPGLATSYIVVGKNWMQHSKRSSMCAIPPGDAVAALLLVQPRTLLSQGTLLVLAQFAVHQEPQVPLHRATPQTVISQPGLLQVFILRSRTLLLSILYVIWFLLAHSFSLSSSIWMAHPPSSLFMYLSKLHPARMRDSRH